MLTVSGVVLLIAATLFTLTTPTMARGPALLALVAFAAGLALLLVGVIRAATTTAAIVAGAFLQFDGLLLFAVGQPRVPPGFMVVAVVLSAAGLWLLLTGVIAAGVGLALRDRDRDRSPGPEARRQE